MKSLNFEFLRPLHPDLAALGGFAEAYAHDDPVGALVKLRTFAEQVVEAMYHDLGLPRPKDWNLYDLLNQDAFKHAVPRAILDALHALRVNGNKAAHGAKGHTVTVLWLLREAFNVGRWLHLTFDQGKPDALPRFEEPPQGGLVKAELRKEKRRALDQIAAMEAQMARLLAELTELRERETVEQKSSAELAEYLRVGQIHAHDLDLDEAATRARFIDEALRSVGWDVGHDGNGTAEVGQEVAIRGVGRADYVLWDDDGSPLAVIEAKKTALDPMAGRTKAQHYADGLEAEYGKRPVIFCSNGPETWIWNDAENEPPRQLLGFYSKDSLQYLVRQRTEKIPLAGLAAEPRIDLYNFQTLAVRQILERFDARHRKALVVMATGTGKTRVAAALMDRLIQQRQVKRVLFLCDRRELRRQAASTFKKLLPNIPLTIVLRDTAEERDKRLYVGTYPALMKVYESFDPGFFDLIVADESHRSLFNYYRVLFEYFDALQVGLTATPRKGLIRRNTYHMFDCEDENPTTFFGYDEAVDHKPPYLSRFEVQEFTTQFLREGIYYSELNRQQQLDLEEAEENPEAFGYSREDIDRVVFNEDTNRLILRNLMENGLRVADGTRLGKTIVFARSHDHAVLLEKLFHRMYPQYGGNFCRIIDSYDPHAEQLIDDFKGVGRNKDLTLAISVDMLDTGIDIPEILNLVFAKPVFSYIKFWQMIGRGTRLCKDLFGPGEHKTKFLIFDHWDNFRRFKEDFEEPAEKKQKSILEVLFATRVELARSALDKGHAEAFDVATQRIAEDLQTLPLTSVEVKPKWREVRYASRPEVLQAFERRTEDLLRNDVAPLMQWRVADDLAACRFDLLVTKLERAKVLGSSRRHDLADEVLGQIAQLPVNLNQVRAKDDVIQRVRQPGFFDHATISEIEEARLELRGLMKYRRTVPGPPPKIVDIKEDPSLFERHTYVPKLEGLDLVAYRERVEKVLRELFDASPVLRKIRLGEPVSDDDLEELRELVLSQHPDLDIAELMIHYPELEGQLDLAIRGIIGLDAEAVESRFHSFLKRHTELSARQIQFLEMLQGYIARFGSVEVERLYEAPFTTFHSEGIEGVFTEEEQIVEILTLVATFQPPTREETLS